MFKKVLIAFVLGLGITTAQADKKQEIEREFRIYLFKFIEYLKVDAGKTFPELDSAKFESLVPRLDVKPVRHLLYKETSKGLSVSTAINIREEKGRAVVYIHTPSWSLDTINSLTTLQTTIHELILVSGQGGEEEKERSAISQRLTSDIATRISQMDDPITIKLASEFEMKRDLNEIDSASVAVVECATKFLEDKLGGLHAVEYSGEIFLKLAHARKLDRLEDIKKVHAYCLNRQRPLSRHKVRRWELYSHADTLEKSKASDLAKLYAFVRNMIAPVVSDCKSVGLTLEGGPILQGSVSLFGVRCIKSNGKQWVAFGPNAGLGLGLGSSITLTRLKEGEGRVETRDETVAAWEHRLINTSPFVFYEGQRGSAAFFLTTLKGWKDLHQFLGRPFSSPRSLGKKEKNTKSYSETAVGFQAKAVSVQMGLRIPILPLRRNWSHVLDKVDALAP